MIRISLAAAAALSLSTAASASAAPPPDGLHAYAALALTPAGDRLAAVESLELFSDAALEPHGRIVVRSARDGGVLDRIDPCTACRYSGLAWSPDGRALAFVASDARTHKAMLVVAAGGRTHTVATIDGVAGTPRWSPDGARIALLAVPGAHKLTGAVEAGAAQVGEIGAAATEDEQRIAVVPAAGGAVRYVSPADTWVYEYDWTPDGRGFVATAAKGNGDNNWWIAKLVGVDLASGATRVIAAPKVQMNFPRVSPDGRSVAFIGGLMSDFGSIGGDIYTVPIGGGEPSDVTRGYKGTFRSLAWRGGALYGAALTGDRTAVFRLQPGEGQPQILRAEPDDLAAGDGEVSLSADGRTGATVAQTFTTAPLILAGPVAAMAPVTHDNDALPPLVQARSVNWTSDGFSVQGWLLAPRTNAASGKHAMVVIVHGGPSAAWTPFYVSRELNGYGPIIEGLAARGDYVFLPNPRGSYGEGEAFTRANVRDFGGGDLRDILAGVDEVERVAPVDDKRLGVFGHSYGGFMTMWTVTHTDRFKAAVAGAGLSNWISYYGENGIDEWMLPFFGASAYDDPAIYQKLSPITYIKNARTPTLIYVGERDVECPPPQSFEFWRGLQAMGVPTTLVVYAGQGHAIRDPADLHDRIRRIVGWFDKYLGG